MNNKFARTSKFNVVDSMCDVDISGPVGRRIRRPKMYAAANKNKLTTVDTGQQHSHNVPSNHFRSKSFLSPPRSRWRSGTTFSNKQDGRLLLEEDKPQIDAKYYKSVSVEIVNWFSINLIQYYCLYYFQRKSSRRRRHPSPSEGSRQIQTFFAVISCLILFGSSDINKNHVELGTFGGIRRASAAMTITQTLRYLRNFGYLYDSINHKDFDFNGGPLPIASSQADHNQQIAQQPVNLRHSSIINRRKSAAALHFQSSHHTSPHEKYDNASNYDSDAISTAIKRFQAFSSLPVTGQIDTRTLKQLKKPRCGNIDLQPNRAKNYLNTRMMTKKSAGMPANYILQGSKWDRTDLTFKIGQYSRTLSRKAVDEVIAEAFSYWSNASKLTFRQIHYGPADIIILFAKGEHGDLSPFDGPQGVLAHAFFPDFGGDTHFDDAERWTHGRKRGVNLLQVAVHELGHALGLDHSDVSAAVMAPFYDGFNSKFHLHADDIKGIRRLYGPPPEIAVVTATKSPQNSSSSSSTTTTTTAPTTTTTAKTSSTTLATVLTNTTMMPLDDVGITRANNIDDETLATVDEIMPHVTTASSLDLLNSTTPDAGILIELPLLNVSSTVSSTTELPSNTSTTPLNTAWWWPPIEETVNDKKSTVNSSEKSTTLTKQQNNTSFFGSSIDEDLLWYTAKKPTIVTVKGKRIHPSSPKQTDTAKVDFNSNEKTFVIADSTSNSSDQSTPTTTTTAPTSFPEEWSLFGLEDLTLQSAKNRKRLAVHKPFITDDVLTTTTTSAPTTHTPQADSPNSYEGTGTNGSLHINLCDPSFRIDAITTIDGVGYMFAGDAYWRVSAMGEVLQPARSILTDWKSSSSSTVPTHIDAALSPTWAPGRTYLFKGNQYWRLNHGEIKTDRTNSGAIGPGGIGRQQFFIEDGYPKLISTGWAGIPDNIESAFQWGRSTRTYFTKGIEIWSFDRTQVPPVRGPKTMPVERGFPARVDAAFRSPSGRTYLFAGDKYYAMSTWSFLISRYYPQLTAERWFGCRPATPSPLDNSLQHNLSDLDQTNDTNLAITPHAAGDVAQIHYGATPDDYGNATTNAPSVVMTNVYRIYPTDIAQPDPTTTEAGHIEWIHSRNDVNLFKDTNETRKSYDSTPMVQSNGMRDSFTPSHANNRGGTNGGGEFLWQSSLLLNSNPQASLLETFSTTTEVFQPAKEPPTQRIIASSRQPKRSLRNPAGRQVRFLSSPTDDRGAATSLSISEANAVALSSRRVASSFGARQLYHHHQHQRFRRNSIYEKNVTESTPARSTQVFYLRRERKLHPLP